MVDKAKSPTWHHALADLRRSAPIFPAPDAGRFAVGKRRLAREFGGCKLPARSEVGAHLKRRFARPTPTNPASASAPPWGAAGLGLGKVG
jgi:hypothetical protein